MPDENELLERRRVRDREDVLHRGLDAERSVRPTALSEPAQIERHGPGRELLLCLCPERPVASVAVDEDDRDTAVTVGRRHQPPGSSGDRHHLGCFVLHRLPPTFATAADAPAGGSRLYSS